MKATTVPRARGTAPATSLGSIYLSDLCGLEAFGVAMRDDMGTPCSDVVFRCSDSAVSFVRGSETVTVPRECIDRSTLLSDMCLHGDSEVDASLALPMRSLQAWIALAKALQSGSSSHADHTTDDTLLHILQVACVIQAASRHSCRALARCAAPMCAPAGASLRTHSPHRRSLSTTAYSHVNSCCIPHTVHQEIAAVEVYMPTSHCLPP